VYNDRKHFSYVIRIDKLREALESAVLKQETLPSMVDILLKAQLFVFVIPNEESPVPLMLQEEATLEDIPLRCKVVDFCKSRDGFTGTAYIIKAGDGFLYHVGTQLGKKEWSLSARGLNSLLEDLRIMRAEKLNFTDLRPENIVIHGKKLYIFDPGSVISRNRSVFYSSPSFLLQNTSGKYVMKEKDTVFSLGVTLLTTMFKLDSVKKAYPDHKLYMSHRDAINELLRSSNDFLCKKRLPNFLASRNDVLRAVIQSIPSDPIKEALLGMTAYEAGERYSLKQVDQFVRNFDRYMQDLEKAYTRVKLRRISLGW